jgi:hypothetical protein
VRDVSVTEGHAGTLTAYLPVSLSARPAAGVSVQYATADGSATAGFDYVATSGTLWFGPNDTVRTIPVVVKGDVATEGDETVVITLANASGATIVDGDATLTILDDEGVPKPPLRSVWNVAQEGMPSISGSAFGAGRYVLVGSHEIWTSTNGVDWAPAANPAPVDVAQVVYAGGQFVAVGGGILTSPDGRAWTQRSSRGGCCVAYGNGRYVVPGHPILTSTDGISWTEHAAPAGLAPWNSIAFGAGVFVVLAHHAVSTSTDGVDWTPRTIPDEMAQLQSVTFAAGEFHAAAGSCCGIASVMKSADGFTWTAWLKGWETTGNRGQGITAAGPDGNLVAVLEHARAYISEGGNRTPCVDDPWGCWPASTTA